MKALAHSGAAHMLPRGPLHAIREVAVFAAAYGAYNVTRGAVDDAHGATVAFQNARAIIDIERHTGLFFEQHVQAWSSRSTAAIDAASWLYVNAQTTVAAAILIFLYLFHNERWNVVRNMVVIAMAIALVGYLAFPTAPPRFFPEWGFQDSVARSTGIDPKDVRVNSLFNPYAAMPSMHFCIALLLGGVLASVCARRPLRALWWSYPALIAWVVIATGNHWTLDLTFGALTAAASYAVATRFTDRGGLSPPRAPAVSRRRR